ncbi:hypothetical protein LX82_01105 [Celeribacter halophilus]|uniref:Uncharacterized protein n=1 Tax=Celeribacter halophilus TaxID=576117 RepID=A0A1I3QWB9_9RHOB|nr:hypothetical protein LX82_01105 [Celeribacter halophilus]SFJ38030.1 hypothetical protein SAMN04488138_104134 [Celeribacter halophilus]
MSDQDRMCGPSSGAGDTRFWRAPLSNSFRGGQIYRSNSLQNLRGAGSKRSIQPCVRSGNQNGKTCKSERLIERASPEIREFSFYSHVLDTCAWGLHPICRKFPCPEIKRFENARHMSDQSPTCVRPIFSVLVAGCDGRNRGGIPTVTRRTDPTAETARSRGSVMCKCPLRLAAGIVCANGVFEL